MNANVNQRSTFVQQIEVTFSSLTNPLALLGRVLLASMFVLAGFDKIGGFEGTAGYIASVGLPMAELLTVLTIAVEIVAGLALILGFQTRLAALALAGFTLAASVLFHNYWAMPAEQAYVQQLMFMKNLSIAGGLLLVAALGGGRWAVSKH
ncbi:DoxX family protein [Limnobacter sp.]|uniref:DoxX family protein n=1 Tax=Limnobacter sp. TaxID=2003368 RepID=UPI003515B6C5